MGATFVDLYKLTGELLGEGSEGRVETCKNVFTGIEYAVRFIICVEVRRTSSNSLSSLRRLSTFTSSLRRSL